MTDSQLQAIHPGLTPDHLEILVSLRNNELELPIPSFKIMPHQTRLVDDLASWVYVSVNRSGVVHLTGYGRALAFIVLKPLGPASLTVYQSLRGGRDCLVYGEKRERALRGAHAGKVPDGFSVWVNRDDICFILLDRSLVDWSFLESN